MFALAEHLLKTVIDGKNTVLILISELMKIRLSRITYIFLKFTALIVCSADQYPSDQTFTYPVYADQCHRQLAKKVLLA